MTNVRSLLNHAFVPAYDVMAAIDFYEKVLGISVTGMPVVDESIRGDFAIGKQANAWFVFDNGTMLHLARPSRDMARRNGFFVNPTFGHTAFRVADLATVRAGLESTGTAFVEAGHWAVPGWHQLYTHDPHGNVLEFQQVVGPQADEVEPHAQNDSGTVLHHVFVPAHDMRASVDFYEEVLGISVTGMPVVDESIRGDFAIGELANAWFVFDNGTMLHLARPSHDMARRNGFFVNPTFGHTAFRVADLATVRAGLESTGTAFVEAGHWAVPGWHQLYTHDPHGNVLEFQQMVGAEADEVRPHAH